MKSNNKTIVFLIDDILNNTISKESYLQNIVKLCVELHDESYSTYFLLNESLMSSLELNNIKLKYTNSSYNLEQLFKQIQEETNSTRLILVGAGKALENHSEVCSSFSIGIGEKAIADFVVKDISLLNDQIKKICELYPNIVYDMLKSKVKGKALVVGINGVDTSGKSMFTYDMQKYISKSGFKVQTIAIDNFHNESSIRYSDPDPIMSYYNNAFDYSKIVNELLKEISDGKEIDKDIIHLNLETDTFEKIIHYNIDKDTIVLLEGVLLFRSPIQDFLDYKIYIHIDFDTVIKRATKRDYKIFGDSVVDRYKSKYIPIQKHYLTNDNVLDKADLVINNINFMKPEIVQCKKRGNDRIKLVPLKESHMPFIQECIDDEEAINMLGHIEEPQYNDYKNSIAFVIMNSDNKMLGQIELFAISWKNSRGELSISLKKEFRGQGIGYLAIKELLHIAFTKYDFHRIWLRVLEDNVKGVKLYKKVGFITEGICREESLRNGRRVNQVQMSLLKTEWL